MKKTLGACLFLILGIAILYLRVSQYPFLNYDDPDYVANNVRVQKGLNWENIQWAFTHYYASNWHPLTWVSHMTDIQFFGMKPGAHHLVNVGFHAATAVLLFLFLQRATQYFWRPLIVASFFAFHPQHVESVAWISERKDVLSAFFWMAACLVYVRYAEKPGFWRYLGVLFLVAAGLLSKPMVVTLPFVFMLLDIWPLRRFSPWPFAPVILPKVSAVRWVLEKVPLFVLVALSCYLTLAAQTRDGSVAPILDLSLTKRLGNAALAYSGYLEKAVWPLHLGVFYPHPISIPWPRVAVSCVVLGIISLFMMRAARTAPYATIGWLWFVGTLVPVIGIVQVGAQAMADRYTYIPHIGLFLIAVWGLQSVIENRPKFRWVGATAAVLVLAGFSFLTYRQVGYWKDDRTLFQHTQEVTGDNILALAVLGDSAMIRGDVSGAMDYFQRSLRLNPNYPGTRFALGVALERLGREEEALEQFQKTIEIFPQHFEAHLQLGGLYVRKNKRDLALQEFNAAVKINPDSPVALIRLAWLLATDPRDEKRDGPRAVTLAERAIRLLPHQSALALNALAAAYAEIGNVNKAIQTGEAALAQAQVEKNPGLISSIERYLVFFREGKPIRE